MKRGCFPMAESSPHLTPRAATQLDALRIGRIPIGFFMVAVAFFALGICTLPFAVADIADFFYQPVPLATVHIFTLGWITMTIMGVMYRYVPALPRHPIASPRVAWLQLVLFAIGASGMV